LPGIARLSEHGQNHRRTGAGPGRPRSIPRCTREAGYSMR
jgi:hypothetical protein